MASKGTPGDAKCVTEVPGGTKKRTLRGETRQVCYHSATQSPQFGVSVPEKLLKIVATRGEIFSLKFTK